MKSKQIGFLIFLLWLAIVYAKQEGKKRIKEKTLGLAPKTVVGNSIQRSLFGLVVKEDGLPLEGARVMVGAEVTITDANGQFFFKSIEMSVEGTLINVQKVGYFLGAKMLSPKSLDSCSVEISMFEELLQDTIYD